MRVKHEAGGGSGAGTGGSLVKIERGRKQQQTAGVINEPTTPTSTSTLSKAEEQSMQ